MTNFRPAALSVCLALSNLSGNAAPTLSALEDGPLGLHPTTGLTLTKGDCADCPSPRQALWYFRDDVIAIPAKGTPAASYAKEKPPLQDVAEFIHGAAAMDLQSEPPLIWTGSPEVIPRARMSTDGKSVSLPGGTRIPFEVVAKIPTNLSYYNNTSTAYLAARPLRLRGETKLDGQGNARFIGRTLWPLDFAITPDATIRPLTVDESLKGLVKADRGGAQKPFSSRLLWEREPGETHDWQDKAVMAVMLNGAQGDDDEAHGGHFAIATGRYRNDGDWSRWMAYNFYNLGSVSEKGIIAAPTPMDKYLFDLNNGQNWYRPSYMLVAVLKQDRTAIKYQAAIERMYNHFYRHDFEYNHSRENCAGISEDVLATLGWQPPRRGHEPLLKAIGAYLYVSATSGSLRDGRKIYDYLLEESIRLYPAATFDALGEDLLSLVQGKANRPLSAYEQALVDDVEAIYYVNIPQIPSNRAFGLAPVYSFDEYMAQAPADRSQWKIIPTDARPFPDDMRDGLALKQDEPALVPLPVALTVISVIGLIYAAVKFIRHFLKRRKAAQA